MNLNFIQLTVRGSPSAFDLSSSNDLCAVASQSPGCISFFHLHELGSPRHVVHYEQPHAIRKLKFQRHSQQLLAALRGDSVSLFDPTKSLRPLQGFVRSKGVIHDMQWSHALTNILATGCDLGDVALWDCRNLSKASLAVNFNFPVHGIEWCPVNSNLLLIEGENHVVVWDCRMNKASSSSVSNKDKDRQAFSMSFNDSVLHSTWCHDDNKPSIITSTSSQKLEWWHQAEGASSDYSKKAVISLPPGSINKSTCFLSSSVGRGLVYSQRDLDGRTSQSSIYLQGHARSGYSLESIFQNPGDVTKHSSEILTDGPRVKLATVDDTVIGMKWGTPGRLLPPAHAGLELLFLTGSARLFAVKIPADVVHHHCGGLASSAISNDPGRPSQQQQQKRGKGGALSLQHVAVAESSVEDISANPTLSMDSLKSSWFPSSKSNLFGLNPFREVNSSENILKRSSQSRDNLKDNAVSSIVDSTGEIFWKSLQREILTLEDQIEKGSFDGLVIGRLDQYARQITLEMRNLFDKEMNFPSEDKNDKSSTNSGPSSKITKDSNQDETISLIIFFPLKFPTLGLPQFTLRTANNSYFSNSAMSAAIVKELTQIAKSFSETNMLFNSDNNVNSVTGFLIDIARCFRNRILQPFTNRDFKDTTDGVEKDEKSGGSGGGSYSGSKEKSPRDRADAESRDNEDSTSGIIKPKAYRIPCPATSGAIFGCNGKLICFGGARLMSKSIGSDNEKPLLDANLCTSSSSSSSSSGELKKQQELPKSYADYQALERWYKDTTEMVLSEENAELPARDKDIMSDRSSNSEEDSDKSSDEEEDEEKKEEEERESINITSKLGKKLSSLKMNDKARKEIAIPQNLQHFQPLLAKYTMLIAEQAERGGRFESPISSFGSSPINVSRFDSPQQKSLRSAILSNFSSPAHSTLFQNIEDEEEDHSSESASNIMRERLMNTFMSAQPRTFTIYEVKDSDEYDIIDTYDVGIYQKTLCRNSVNKNSNVCAYQLDVDRKGLDERLLRCKSYIEALKANNCANPSKLAKSLTLWWNMFSVSLEVLALPWEGGTLISWTESSLGCSLMFELFCYLRHSKLQATLATAIALLGGSKVVVDLLKPEINKRLQKSQKISTSGGVSPNSGGTTSSTTSGNSSSSSSSSSNSSSSSSSSSSNNTSRSSSSSSGQNISLLAALGTPSETLFVASDLDFTESSWFEFLEYSLKVYIEFLTRQGLIVKALEANKYLASGKVNDRVGEAVEESLAMRRLVYDKNCSSCGSEVVRGNNNNNNIYINNNSNDDRCENCTRKTVYCSICTLPVSTINIFCIRCGHGGHPDHMAGWFEGNKFCPTGCGCKCSINKYFEHDHDRDSDVDDDLDNDDFGVNDLVTLKDSHTNIRGNKRFFKNSNNESSSGSESDGSSSSSSSSSDSDDSDSSSSGSSSSDSIRSDSGSSTTASELQTNQSLEKTRNGDVELDYGANI